MTHNIYDQIFLNRKFNQIFIQVQREIWRTGAEEYLIKKKGYDVSAEMLIHSLQDNPSSITYGGSSKICQLIKANPEFNKSLDNVLEGKEYKLNNDNILIPFKDGDLAYSIHRSSFSFNGYQKEDGTWMIHATMHDVYDFTEFMMVTHEDKWKINLNMGTLANDAGTLSQMAGGINPYDVYVDFWMTR